MSVTAILVTYNSESVIAGALEALRGCGVARCLVVDNASRDATVDVARAAWPEAEIIQNTENIGFGRANNMALQQVETEFALLANPDARVDAACLQALLAAAARCPEAAIIAPQLLDETGRVHASYKQSVFVREHTPGGYVAPCGDLCAGFLSGAVWLVRMSAFKSIGFFDPRIFLYYEDDDLCLRARAAGFSCVLAHEARAVHVMGKSSASAGDYFRHKHMAWSRLYIEQKYKGQGAAKRLAAKMLLVSAGKFLLHIGSARRARYAGRVRGVLIHLA